VPRRRLSSARLSPRVQMPEVRCKVYHRARSTADAGELRRAATRKSRCPGWAQNPAIQRLLIETAIPDQDRGTDAFGRTKVIWNAVEGWYFIGVSTNEPVAAYNCYPEVPLTVISAELSQRAERSLAQALTSGEPQ